MRFFVVVGSLFLGIAAWGNEAGAPASCKPGAPHPDNPREFEQFAFLIGDFAISSHVWQGDQWSPPRPGPKARWNGWYGLGGMAIYDEWFDPDPAADSGSPRGVNVRIFDPALKQWKMMWIHSATRQVQDLRAEIRDGVLTMWQVYPERPNFYAEFHQDDENRWHRISYTLDEQGEWVPQFKLAATRLDCSN